MDSSKLLHGLVKVILYIFAYINALGPLCLWQCFLSKPRHNQYEAGLRSSSDWISRKRAFWWNWFFPLENIELLCRGLFFVCIFLWTFKLSLWMSILVLNLVFSIQTTSPIFRQIMKVFEQYNFRLPDEILFQSPWAFERRWKSDSRDSSTKMGWNEYNLNQNNWNPFRIHL